MSADAIVGALRGVLVLDTADWTPAIGRVRSDLGTVATAFEQLRGKLDNIAGSTQRLGLSMIAGLTVPLATLGAAANKTASGFEASMKRVEAALKGVSGGELKALSDQARSLGPAVGKGATEAADGIEALGLAGVATADILGGGLKSALDLAAAGAAPVADAASLVTDVMGQFKVKADELPIAVRNVVGALDASKFGFIDFQQAVAQGGGVAASAGVSFSDFATAIAATSTQFSSGSDAGTSFKTYIQSLVPVSKEAERAMNKLGINFFDLKTGRMKPLAEQAEILRNALIGLSDQSKTDALKTIFGSDAARTAIGLMEQGRQGIVDLQGTIAGGDVSGKISKRLEGEAAATQRMANAFESLKISIGEAGLTAAMTAIKSSFASVLESLAGASPAVHKVGVAFGLLASAAGPLVLMLGTIGKVIIAKFASGFGMIGRLVGLIVSPVTTIIGLLGEVGLRGVLTMLGRAMLGVTGPIGIAVTAFLVFKDYIIDALALVWKSLSDTLGPPLSAIMDKCQAIFAKLSGGAIGSAFSTLMGWLGNLRDFLGTGLAAGIVVSGEVIERTLGVIIAAIGGLVDVVSGVVDVISALLAGDFSGAWKAVVGIVESVCGAIVDMAAALVPEVGTELQLVYAAAKAWLGDGFASIGQWFAETVQTAVNYVANAFPTVVTAAKGVYEGVKGWLVDKFGGLMTWIGNAAKWIGDKYAAMKERLGLGSVGQDETPAAPAAPAAGPAPRVSAPPGTRTVSFDDPKAPKKTRAARERKGRDTSHDQENREQLALQVELEAARERGDKAAEQRLQDRLALSRQIEAYTRAGLSVDQARVAANRDMAAIAAARAESSAREIADEQASTAIEVARLGHNQALVESLERQAELKRRIAFYYEQTKNLGEATRLAEADQVKMDEARAAVRAEWFEADQRERAVDLARARGDSEERIRLLQREIDTKKRARELEQQGVDSAEAATRAATEWDEADKARMTGNFRQTFKDGVRAALDGNLGDFFKNWWKDRMAKGMEDALNSLSDIIAGLFDKLKGGTGGAGGGSFWATIGSVLGSITGKGKPSFGGGSTGGDDPVLGPMDFPGFRTGGSFTVGGMSGVDANLVAFRATKGEMVDIRRPGNDNRSMPTIVQLVVGEGQTFEPRVQSISGDVSVRTTRASNRRASLQARQSLA